MTDHGISDFDLYLFGEGNHQRIYHKLGAHAVSSGAAGTRFAVWAPNAERVSVVGPDGYEIGVEEPGQYRRLFDSDDTAFGGSRYNQQLQVQASSNSAFGRPQVIKLNLPPLGAMFFAGP